MAKKLVDANVILRYLLRDNETLFQKASDVLEKVRTGEEKVVILESVLTECVYVLLKVYGVNRSTILRKQVSFATNTFCHYWMAPPPIRSPVPYQKALLPLEREGGRDFWKPFSNR